ncbi:MAG: cell division protein FtsA [Fusobacteriaceae bacterium]
MSSNENFVKAVIDIGNSKIKILLGESSEMGGEIKIIGTGESETKGLKKSLIENPEDLTESIKKAIKSVKETLKVNVEKATVGISSPNIKSKTISKKINFPECEITQKEINLLFEEAEKEVLKSGEKVIKKEMYNIRVNNSGIIKNPLEILGKELQADVHLICIDESEYKGYEEVVNRAGLMIENIVLNSCGSAEAVLDEEEKNMGVALIDIGEGITDILMFKNGKLIYSRSIPLGGMHYINDISYILDISREESFEILKKMKTREINDESIEIKENKMVTVQYIKNIIDARTEDITKFIVQTIEESGFNGYLGKGIVITGGTVVLEELLKKIASETGYKVIKKRPLKLDGLNVEDASYASAIGILIDSINIEKNSIEEKRIEKSEKIEIFDFEKNKFEEKFEIEEETENEDKKSKGFFKNIMDKLSNYI